MMVGNYIYLAIFTHLSNDEKFRIKLGVFDLSLRKRKVLAENFSPEVSDPYQKVLIIN